MVEQWEIPEIQNVYVDDEIDTSWYKLDRKLGDIDISTYVFRTGGVYGEPYHTKLADYIHSLGFSFIWEIYQSPAYSTAPDSMITIRIRNENEVELWNTNRGNIKHKFEEIISQFREDSIKLRSEDNERIVKRQKMLSELK